MTNQWWKDNLKFSIDDWKDTECERCETIKPIVKTTFGYGSSYNICKECFEDLKCESEIQNQPNVEEKL